MPPQTLHHSSASYPLRLKQIHKPPETLYYQGNLELINHPKCIAIVGPRKATQYGQRVATEFVTALSQSGYCIVSGLAQGIDTTAHKTALANNAPTIAILGCGLDIIFPAHNYELYQKIAQSGLILTEYPQGTPPLKHNFPYRNRIISGLSQATLIVEAHQRSGSLITAECAWNQEREVYAVPGSIYHSSTAGVHQLISDNKAKLIHSPEQLLQELTGNSQLEFTFAKPAPQSLTSDEQNIIDLLTDSPLTALEIAESQNIPLTQINALLTQLELKELIKKIPGGRYQSF